MSPTAEPSRDFCEYVTSHASLRDRHTNTLRLLAGGLVDIYVGASRKQYQVHKTLLCHRSAFFRAAFCGPFMEAASSTLSMVDDAPEVFDLVVRWIYKGTIDPLTREHLRSSNNNNSSSSSSSDNTRTTTAAPLIHLQLFVLADKLQMPDLQDCVLDAIRRGLRRANTYLAPGQIVYVLNNAPATSVLRRFTVDLAAFAVCRMRIRVDTFRPCFEESADFACELTTAVLAALTPFHPVRDPRGRLSLTEEELGCEWGRHGVYADAGNSMRANVSQGGSEDFPVWGIPPPSGW